VGAGGEPVKSKANLNDIIQECYRVFKQRGPTTLDVCTRGCCMSPTLEKEILQSAQSNITLGQLNEWFSAASAEKPNIEALRFLLPRILELSGEGEDLYSCGNEAAFRRFGFFSRTEWSSSERKLLEKFRLEFLNLFRSAEFDWLLDEAVCMFHGGGWPLEDLFEQIYSWPTEDIVNRYWQDWNREGFDLIRVSYFWEKHERQNLLEMYCTAALEDRFIELAVADGIESELRFRAEIMAAVMAQNAKS